MRVTALVATGALLLLGSACSSSSTSAGAAPAAVAAPAVNPTGRWNVALTAQGQPFDFVMELRQVDGNQYGGVVTSQMFPPMNINRATLNGNQMRINVTAPTGDEATFTITFEGDAFTGDWSMPGDGSRVTGRRIQ